MDDRVSVFSGTDYTSSNFMSQLPWHGGQPAADMHDTVLDFLCCDQDVGHGPNFESSQKCSLLNNYCWLKED